MTNPRLSDAHQRLRSEFAIPEWNWLRRRLRECFEQEKPLPATMRCGKASATQRRLIGAVRGMAESSSLPLAAFEQRLQDSGQCGSLQEWVEILDGPLTARAAARREQSARWTRIEEAAMTLRDPAICAEVNWKPLTRNQPEQAESLLRQLESFFAERTSFTGCSHARVAAELFGDSHALDRDALLYRALAALAGCDPAQPRTVWARFGLVADEVNSHALVWGLRFRGTSTLANGLNSFAAAREPVRVLLRHLRNDLTPDLPDARLYVCENPAVLEAAAGEAGWRHPLLCVEGNPSQTSILLLQAALVAGANLHYHGDFDWGGLRIANRVRALNPTQFVPWQFDAATYGTLEGGHPLRGQETEAEWDEALAAAMRERGRGFHEEQVVDRLLQGT